VVWWGWGWGGGGGGGFGGGFFGGGGVLVGVFLWVLGLGKEGPVGEGGGEPGRATILYASWKGRRQKKLTRRPPEGKTGLGGGGGRKKDRKGGRAASYHDFFSVKEKKKAEIPKLIKGGGSWEEKTRQPRRPIREGDYRIKDLRPRRPKRMYHWRVTNEWRNSFLRKGGRYVEPATSSQREHPRSNRYTGGKVGVVLRERTLRSYAGTI